MGIFYRPKYESEVTQFIKGLKEKKPTLEAEQLQGRALLWDVSVDRQLQAEMRQGRVPQRPYVYGSN